MKRNLTVILLSAVVLLVSFTIKSNHKLDDDDLEHLYRCFFNNPYQYMFSSGEKIEMNGAYYGLYRSGINGILFYGGLQNCLGDLSKDKGWSDSGKDAFEWISGVPATTGKMHGFDVINPEIVKWGYENMIPDPKGDLDGWTYQEVYDEVFYRYFRLMTRTYLYTQKYTDLEVEKAEYIKAFEVDKYGVDDHLRQRYAYIPMLIDIDCEPDGTAWTVPMGIGFWIRRSLDGSDEEIFHGLEKLMKMYDGEWYKKIVDEMDGSEIKYEKAEACGSCDCDVTVYIENYIGVKFYSEPSTKSKVVEEIKGVNQTGSCDTEYLFLEISGYKNGWYRVSAIEGDECHEKKFGTGAWINGVQLMSSVRGYGDRGAPAYTKATQDGKVFDMFAGESYAEVIGCEGKWVLVHAKDKKGEQITGWLQPEEQCPNPYTTCP